MTYNFEPAFPPGHFVSEYIDYASERTDAAHEFHEAMALMLLAMATPDLRLNVAQFQGGLRTNLYLFLVGITSLSRKSTSAEIAEDIAFKVWPYCKMPAKSTPEAFAEDLAQRTKRASLWYSDEFGKMLKQMKKTEYMGALEDLLLQLYGRPDYTYKRMKGVVDIKDSFLNIVGCSADTIFNALYVEDVESGLLPRFGIIMPATKPEMMPFSLQSVENVRAQNRLVLILNDISPQRDQNGAMTSTRNVTISEEVLAVASAFNADFSRRFSGELFARLPPMLFKVAMLSAVGDHSYHKGADVAVLADDIRRASLVIERWAMFADAFQKRLGETKHDKEWKKALDWLTQKNVPAVGRRTVMRALHFNAQQMDAVEATLEGQGHIFCRADPNATKRHRYKCEAWEFAGYIAPGTSPGAGISSAPGASTQSDGDGVSGENAPGEGISS